jgi:hypothetical protein
MLLYPITDTYGRLKGMYYLNQPGKGDFHSLRFVNLKCHQL